MKVQFLGAAQTVTGSCFYFSDYNNTKFLVDCGMYQGDTELKRRNFLPFSFSPSDIDFVILTHSHIDHSGLLPKLVRDGFKGRIYATEATKELSNVMLQDSAHIQEMEAELKNKKRRRSGNKALKPLYTQKDALNAYQHFTAYDYGETFMPAPGIKVRFHDAGHILGSSFLEVDFESLELKKWVFSGDLGKRNQPIIRDPEKIREADVLFMESTYGNRNHKSMDETIKEFDACIEEFSMNKGRIIFPAFTVGRTQTIVYHLFRLFRQGKLPDYPVYIDSPMAVKITEIYKRFKNLYDDETQRIEYDSEDVFSLPNLKLIESVAESKEINKTDDPCIIISASGMCDAGRIKHHLKNNLYRDNTQVVITGFQSQGTLGRALVDGMKTVEILGDDIIVNAKIVTLNGFSAHADQNEMMEWLTNFTNRKLKLFLVHGEFAAASVMKNLLDSKFQWETYMPEWEDTAILEGSKFDIYAKKPSIEIKHEIEDELVSWNSLVSQVNNIVREKMSSSNEIDKAWIWHFMEKTNRSLRRVLRKHGG
ncbi:MAG: MBL fold metallo-hydrolase [Candidatus Coatesbacteria bacterium]|nr:MBL fold metallo-hydrolase [Candidatus Coatesbacteria bacterium]